MKYKSLPFLLLLPAGILYANIHFMRSKQQTKHIPGNRIIIRTYEILRKCSRVKEELIFSNASSNLKNLGSVVVPGMFVEDQSDPRWKNITFGKSDMNYSGCEIFAVYNALLSLGHDGGTDMLTALISHFENDGSALCGKWGVSPVALKDFFEKSDYTVVHTDSDEPAAIDRICGHSDTCIATVLNDRRNIFREIHTVSISRDRAGHFHLHNAGHDRSSGYIKISDAVYDIAPYCAPVYTIGISCHGSV